MKLEHLFEFSVGVKKPAIAGATPTGQRMIADLTGGTFEGPKLKGTVRASGADWALVGSDGVIRVDVRAVLETDDGAVIYMPYRGRLVVNGAVGKVLSSGEGGTEYGDTYWITQVQFETGDERYTWLNSVMAVGEGKIAPDLATYRVSAVMVD
ncbi:MAG TPA: DUF3237 domain-containing protein [Sneathiellales bacterium]|nr:DUF3237 domain-containing protein [Sneathiellales bacterium]